MSPLRNDDEVLALINTAYRDQWEVVVQPLLDRMQEVLDARAADLATTRQQLERARGLLERLTDNYQSEPGCVCDRCKAYEPTRVFLAETGPEFHDAFGSDPPYHEYDPKKCPSKGPWCIEKK